MEAAKRSFYKEDGVIKSVVKLLRLTLVLASFLLTISCAALAASGRSYTLTHQLGDTTVYIDVADSGHSPVYVALHDSENTAVKAAADLPGFHVTLRHSGQRNVSFRLDGVEYVFDPNRIFTNNGIEDTLRRQGGTYSEEAHKAVFEFARVLILLVEPFRRRVVALHNNTNGNYSISTYLPGGSEEANARSHFTNPDYDSDDFFLTTSWSLYQSLKKLEYNVVLQAFNPVDDGSLSVYCANLCRAGYVNVEAQHGHQAIQTEMLRALGGIP